MAKQTQTKTSSPGLVELFKLEQDLQLQLENIRQKKADLAKEHAESIKREVQITLEELAAKIKPLLDQGAWNLLLVSWRRLK